MNTYNQDQKTIFKLMLKNNTDQTEQVETKFESEISDTLIDYMNQILTYLNAMVLDIVKIKSSVTRSRGHAKKIEEAPRLNIIELSKLLKNKQPVKNFNPKETDLATLDEIKSRLSMIDGELDKSQEEVSETNDVFENANFIEQRQIILKEMWEKVSTSIETTIFTPLNEMIDVLKNKLQTFTIKKVIGGGSLKNHPMYKPTKYY